MRLDASFPQRSLLLFVMTGSLTNRGIRERERGSESERERQRNRERGREGERKRHSTIPLLFS